MTVAFLPKFADISANYSSFTPSLLRLTKVKSKLYLLCALLVDNLELDCVRNLFCLRHSHSSILWRRLLLKEVAADCGLVISVTVRWKVKLVKFAVPQSVLLIEG